MLLKKITNRIHNQFYNLKIKRVHAEHRRLNAKKYEYFDRIVERYRSSGGLKHDFQSYKLFSLSELLAKEKPLSILELGTGSTTAVFAEYIRKGDNTHLTCVDESEHWLEKNKELAGVVGLESRVEFLYAPKVFSDYLTPKEINYNIKCSKLYDFVFIDGPSLKVNGSKIKDAVNGNIFDIVDYGRPRIIVVDIRKATVLEIIRRLGKCYEVDISDVITKNIKKDYRYFSIFRLNSKYNGN